VSILNAVCTNAACKVFLLHYYALEEIPSFCPVCGAGVIEKCPRCDALIKEHGDPSPVFCDKCGQRLRFEPDQATGRVSIIIDR
jgi:hypothetical protein